MAVDGWGRVSCDNCGGQLNYESEICQCAGKPAPVAGRSVPMPLRVTVEEALRILWERYVPE